LYQQAHFGGDITVGRLSSKLARRESLEGGTIMGPGYEGRRWLVKVKGQRDGELFKMHSATKWCWLRYREWSPQSAGETVRQNIHRNGYIHAANLNNARVEIARRANAVADEVQLELNDTR
jgi:hypothetical protein